MRETKHAFVAAAALMAAVLAGASSAWAEADVAILPVRVSGYPREQVQQQVRTSVERVLGARAAHLEVQQGPAGTVPIADACVAQASCRAELIRDAYDELALIAVTRLSDEKARMQLQLFDISGAPTLDVASEFEVGDAEREARGLLTLAFAPARYAGTLQVVGAPAGAELLVGGLPIAGAGEPLRVGTHQLVVKVDGAEVERQPVVIAFDRTTEITVGVRPRVERHAPAGAWLAAGVGAVCTGVAVGLAMFAESADPTGSAAPGVPDARAVARIVAVGAGGVAAVASVAAITAFVAISSTSAPSGE